MMFKKRVWVLVGLSVALGLGGSAFLSGPRNQAEARFGCCKLEGTWMVRISTELFYATFASSSGSRGTITADPVLGDATLDGFFPTADSPGPGARGNFRRIAKRSWEFSIVRHGRSLPKGDDPGAVVYIEVLGGVSSLSDCDTQEVTIDLYDVYTADADGDGDGLPDEGAEPVAQWGGLGITGIAKRI